MGDGATSTHRTNIFMESQSAVQEGIIALIDFIEKQHWDRMHTNQLSHHGDGTIPDVAATGRHGCGVLDGLRSPGHSLFFVVLPNKRSQKSSSVLY